MYQVIVHFSYQNFEQDPVTLISQVLNQWRYNGQVIGREMGITHHQHETLSEFQVRVSTPEQESLLPEYNNEYVNEALLQAENAGVQFEYFELVGRDYNAEETGATEQATFQIIYTTYVETCSPIYNGKTFRPIPLYRFGDQPELTEAIIKWQENWQSCDQLQMNGGALEQQALAEISEFNSELNQYGRLIGQALENLTCVPTYYYLYRLGKDEATEHQRQCPSCGGKWKLTEPLHGIFHFKCDDCRLVSNLSWELQ
ncbi:Zn-ribbon-containing protein [Glaesserella sp.]|uniref:Zn-ribbon-containing protein n=1 Tax=Glaesserella sp. TaxID=2094731 RepID=UPI00359F1C80